MFDGKPGSGPPAGCPWVGGWREGALLNCQSAWCSGLRAVGRGIWEWALRGGGLLMHGVCSLGLLWIWASDARCVRSGPVVDLAEEVSGRRR